MKHSIEEQKRFLTNLLVVESLTKKEENREHIKTFEQATKGDHISEYLQNKSWDDDVERNTKVFLVKDKETNQIVFYFAINCGILFSDLNPWNLSEKERVPFDMYVNAVQELKKPNLNSVERDIANNKYNESIGKLWEAVEDPDRVSYLLSLADEKVQLLEEKRESLSDTDEVEHVQPVQETFPAIDIKFLGRNNNYKPSIKLDFKLGVFVFWELIVPHLLEIAEMVGCKYIYLFAADNTGENNESSISVPMWTPDYDPDDDVLADKDEGDKGIHRLVSYYINELKFKYVTKYKILKPHYERTCFTLVQEVDQLTHNRERVWKSHMMEDDINN